jgi:outer membrane protein OmpA-like peptidoglycan-associated protein
MRLSTTASFVWITAASTLIVGPGTAPAQTVLSGFEGSVELGRYTSDYDRLAYPAELANGADVLSVEGAMISRVFEKPEGRSNLEVFRSYERELASAGFTIHSAGELTAPTSFLINQVYGPNTPSFSAREYGDPTTGGRASGLELSFIVGLADHYLVASRTSSEQELWVAIATSGQRPKYIVEELTRTTMAMNTVTLDLDRLRTEIESAGRIAIYDIHFATGSAVIEPESADALDVIAEYLGETPGGFYIVGHTDDTGSLTSNLELSDARAAAVKDALVSEHDVSADRLETRGVGPLAPISNNAGEAGRALNRRVEIVQRLEGVGYPSP